jgi:glycosyltransferase involved in cell wall biosynthesis
VIHDGVDTEIFDPEPYQESLTRNQLGLGPHTKIVLMVARLVPGKRHGLMIEALRLVRRRIDGVQLVCVGEVSDDTHYFETVKRKVAELGLTPDVKFFDFQEDVAPFYAAADLLV